MRWWQALAGIAMDLKKKALHLKVTIHLTICSAIGRSRFESGRRWIAPD
jgi:hypothetical protein